MKRTLWRNGELLGELVVETPAENGIAGMLVPTASFRDIRPLIQARMHLIPGAPIFEMAGIDMSQPSIARSEAPDQNAYPLRPISEKEAGGLPVEAILEIREDGRRLDLDTISVLRFPIPAPEQRSEINELCRAAGVAPSGWLVSGHKGNG